MNVREMIDRRVKLGEESKAILEKSKKEGRALLNGEEQAKFDELHKEIGDLRDKISAEEKATQDQRDRQTRQEELDRELSQSRGRQTQSAIHEGVAAPSDDERRLAFRAWCLGERAEPRMLEAANRLGLNLRSGHLDVGMRTRRGDDGKIVRSFEDVRTNAAGDILGLAREADVRALAEGVTTTGGNSVSNEMMRKFVELQKWFGNVRGLAEVIQTETGATLPVPTISDTSNTGEIIGEGTTATTNADPAFDVVNLSAWKFSSKAVYVSWELLQDSFINLEEYLGTRLGTRIARIQNNKFTVGAGTTEPRGLVTAAAAGVTAALTNSFTPDEVISLVHSLDPAYRAMPGVGFMFHDTIAKVIRQFKDGQGRYMWEMSVQLGQPDRLLGFPVTINNDMASALTTGQKLLLFGNFGGYIVRDAGAVKFLRLGELAALQGQVIFMAYQRSDGNLPDTTSVKRLTLG